MAPRMLASLMFCLSALHAVPSAAEPDRKSLVLSDFTVAAERARWDRWHGVTEDAATPGRFVYPAWRAGMDEWPAIRLRLRDGIPANWDAYDVLCLDVLNPGAETVDAAVYIGDPESENTARHFLLAPGENQVRYPVFEMERVNVGRLSEVRVFLTRPERDTPLVFRRLRLDEDLDARLESAAGRFAALAAEAERDGFPGLLAGRIRGLELLRSRLDAAATAGERDALRPAVMDADAAAVQSGPRLLSEARMWRAWRGLHPSATWALGFATGLEKVFPRDIPFRARVGDGEVSLAGNEREAVQLLILAGPKGLRNARVEVSSLERDGGGEAFPASAVRVAPVGFAETKRPPYRADYVGWYPDPILDFLESFDVRPGEIQPVWVGLKAPAGQAPGTYRGRITVRADGEAPQSVGLRVNVWGFDLPKETHLRTALSFREDSLANVYGTAAPEMVRKYEDLLLSYRMNPDNIYRTPVTGGDGASFPVNDGSRPTFTAPPPLESLLRWKERGMNAFNIVYVMKPKDLKPGDPYPAERKRQILALLDEVVPVYRRHGLYDKAYVYGFDEVNADTFNAMRDIFSAIKAKYPDLPILTTAYDATYGEASNLPMVDNWVPVTWLFQPDRVAKARERGKSVWWYICVVPKAPYANIFLEYPAIDGRVLMGLQTAKFQPGGFLYYAVNRWPLSKKPITEGPYTDWDTWSFGEYNGDGSFLCAGPDGPLATIRMENMADGIEDNEYHHLLRMEAERLKGLRGARAARARQRVEKALVIGDGLVKSLTEYTKSPDDVLAWRRSMAEAILAAREVTGEPGG